MCVLREIKFKTNVRYPKFRLYLLNISEFFDEKKNILNTVSELLYFDF